MTRQPQGVSYLGIPKYHFPKLGLSLGFSEPREFRAAGMNLRFWKSEPEKRESAPYTDAITRAIVQAAAGRTVGSVAESAALEVAAGMYSRAFSLATLTPPVPCLTPEVLALIARDLIRRGENIHLIEVKRGKLCLTPVGSWDVRGREVESGLVLPSRPFRPFGKRHPLRARPPGSAFKIFGRSSAAMVGHFSDAVGECDGSHSR